MEIVKKIAEALKDSHHWKMFAIACVFSLIMVLVGGAGLKNVFFDEFSTEEEQIVTETVDFTEFLKLLDGGKLVAVEFDSTKLTGENENGDKFVLNHDRRFLDDDFPQELARQGVKVTFPDLNERSASRYFQVGLQIAFQVILLSVFVMIGMFFLMNMKKMVNPSWPNVAPKMDVRFTDVAGQEESKFELEEIKLFLTDPESYEKSGARAPRGVLMVGPPGNGKTKLAQALAGEVGCAFIHITGSDFSNMFVGTGRDRVEKLFKKAKKSTPCIVFIDEIDGVARARGGSTTDVGREQDTTLNQLLTEMDGFNTSDGIIVIGASNRLDVLDPAILRPGRFDRHVTLGLPTVKDREKIFNVHIAGKKIDGDVDLLKIAKGTPGFSGADIENLINEAATFAARNRRNIINISDFNEARDKVLMGAKRSTNILDEDERKLTAYHEAGHAVVASLTKGADPIHKATIIPRSQSLGHVMQVPDKEWKALPKSRLLAKLDVLVAGRAAEEIKFGKDEVTTGAASDIEEVTKIATLMVTEWGMTDDFCMMRITAGQNGFSENVTRKIESIIKYSFARAKEVLDKHGDGFERVAIALLENETLTGKDIDDLLKAAQDG